MTARARGARVLLWLRLVALAALASFWEAGAAPAQVAALERDERRAVQAALAHAGLYDGLIDGAFGARSGAALDAWRATPGERGRGADESLGRLMHRFSAAWADEGWAEVPVGALAQRFVAPFGIMQRSRQAAADFAWLDPGGRIVVMVHRESPGAMGARHDTVAYLARPGSEVYQVRRETLRITGVDTGTGAQAQRQYLRSVRIGGSWETVSVKVRAEDAGLLMLVAGTIGPPPLAVPAPPRAGTLAALVARIAPPDDLARPTQGRRRVLTAVAVNRTDMIAAAAAVEGCATLAGRDGEALAVVAVDPASGLALLRGGGGGATTVWVALAPPGPLLPGLEVRLTGVQPGGPVLSLPGRVAAVRLGVFVAGDPGSLASRHLTEGRIALATSAATVAPGWAITGPDAALVGLVLPPPGDAPARPVLAEGSAAILRFLIEQGAGFSLAGDAGTGAPAAAVRLVTCRG